MDNLRLYEADKDLAAVQRIWKEVGWVDSDTEAGFIKDLLLDSECLVGTIDEQAECSVIWMPGRIHHLDSELKLAVVAAVTTSHIARKSGFASKLTAWSIQRAAEQGCQVAALGIFDQGYYDKFGFGCMSYEHELVFDPALLNVPALERPPKRLSIIDFKSMHACLERRASNHGGVFVDGDNKFKAELGWIENGFGLGFFDEGELSHFIYCSSKGENGPLKIHWKAYSNANQLLELLAVIKSLGDQVLSVQMDQPAGIQLQDLLDKPFRSRTISRNSVHHNRHWATAYWQLRILDLPGCMNKSSFNGSSCVFNLELEDPVSQYLSDRPGWQGAAGQWRVSLGNTCTAEQGNDPTLETLRCSVNAFTRLWMGVVSASGLSVTDTLSASPALLAQLDALIRLPDTCAGYEF